MDFILTETEFNKENIAWNGNRFLIGNGYFGIRGTLEEYTKKQMYLTAAVSRQHPMLRYQIRKYQQLCPSCLRR